MSEPIVRLEHINKRFGGVRALNDVSLAIYPGEVLAVVGENGAGKSTLIKVLAGAHQPDPGGALYVHGRKVEFAGPRDAVRHGISTVYQEPTFYPFLSVLENFFTGEEILSAIGNIDWRTMRRRAADFFQSIGLAVGDLDKPMSALTIGQQQLVLFARAAYRRAEVLILDEPTSVLSQTEAEVMFELVRKVRADGKSVVYITHRMPEIFLICDRAVVLRDGALVGEKPVAELNENALVQMMSGRDIRKTAYRAGNLNETRPLLEVADLTRAGMYRGVSFAAYPGQVLGFYGLVGSGRSEVARTIFGDMKADSGQMIYDGQKWDPHSPKDAMRMGIAYTPEDRKMQGTFAIRPVSDNLTAAIRDSIVKWGGLIDRVRETGLVGQHMSAFAIKASSPEAPISSLSGGNQQKVVLARWMAAEPRLLILDEPTRGIDVGTKTEIHRVVSELAAQGMCIILITSELPELLALCDTVLVLHEGEIAGRFTHDTATEEAVVRCAIGLGQGNGGADHAGV